MGFGRLTPLSSFEIPALACLSPVLTSSNTGEEDFFDAIKVPALCLGSFFQSPESVAESNQTPLFVPRGSRLPLPRHGFSRPVLL